MLCVCVRVCVFLTQWDLLPRVGRQKEDEQGQSGDQDARDEQIEAVVQSPSPHHHGEGDVRVRLLTAVVETLVLPSWNLCETKQNIIYSGRNGAIISILCTSPTTGPAYPQDPTLRWRCSRWYLPPTSSSPETSPHMSRSQTSGHISAHQRGTSAHRCGRCSWRSLL